MNIAVIPARGGSKRIPRKNIRPFCGKPMLAWSIEAALSAGCFDQVIVSTDDYEIATTARDLGAQVPFLRDPNLADDHTGTDAVVVDAITTLQQEGVRPDLVCCIYATAPFISAEYLLKGLQAMQTSDCEFAFSVTSFPFPVQRALRITKTGRTAMLQPEHIATRSQDLEQAYHDAGQFYWGRCNAWLNECPVFGESSAPVEIPRAQVQDIDTEEDWQRAQWLFQAMRAGY